MYFTEIALGARLKLTKKSEKGYKVIVPVRSFDGSLDFEPGWVKPDAHVSVGYQSYTQRNVINAYFRLLNQPYGWAESNHERDCCGTTRAVFKTFGFITGRWTTHQLYSTDHVKAFPRDLPSEEKFKLLDPCKPATCFIGNYGHIILYLGKVDNDYYVIHQSGFSYNKDDTTMHVRKVSLNKVGVEPGSHVNRWTEINEIKP